MPAVEDTPLAAVGRIESEMELPNGFFQRLQQEDDWSFIIKLHALFEAALTHVIVHKLGFDALTEPLNRLEMSDTRRGKVAIANALGLLSSEEKGFLSILSKLRNDCAHDVRQAATFNLVSTCAAMSRDKQTQLVKAICGSSGDERVEENGHTVTRREMVLRSPKYFLWVTGMYVLAVLCVQKETEDYRRSAEATRAKQLELLLELREKETGVDPLREVLIHARATREKEKEGSQNNGPV